MFTKKNPFRNKKSTFKVIKEKQFYACKIF